MGCSCELYCEGGQQVGFLAMALVLRAKGCMLGCLLSVGLRCSFESG